MNHLEVQNSAMGTGRVLRPDEFARTIHSTGFTSLMRLLSRRWQWLVASVLICAAVAVIVSVVTRPIYEATATIELNKGTSLGIDAGLGDVLAQPFNSDSDSLLTDQQTETAILQGDSLGLAVIEKLGLASLVPYEAKRGPDPEQGLPLEEAPQTRTRLLGAFKKNLKVSPVRGTRLIQVSFQSENAKQAAQVANALIDAYKDQYLLSHYKATSETSDWLAKQLSDLKANVEASEKKLTDFEKDNGILSLDALPMNSGNGSAGGGQIHSVTIQKLDQLNTELTAAEANRIEKEAIYHLAQSNSGDVVLGLASDPLALQSNSTVLNQAGGLSNLQQLKQQENELKMRMAAASTTYGANNRHLKEMQTELQALNEQVHLEMIAIGQRAGADFRLAKQTEDQIRKQFDQQQAEAGKLNEKTVQLAVLSQEANSRKRLYEDLYTKLQEANVSAGLTATNITVVDPARSQSIPVKPKKTTNLALGVFFGMFFGLASAYAFDALDRTVSNPMEVEELTGKPVIGAIPSFEESVHHRRLGLSSILQRMRIKDPTDKTSNGAPVSIWILDHPRSAAAEGFRVLRTSILLSRPGGGLKTVLITGCAPGEGKTTIAANLAVAFAQHDKKVILVEADMRRPVLTRKMDFRGKVGLSNVLTGTCSVDDAIVRGSYVSTLDILPAGPHPPMPSEILGSSAFDGLMEKLKSQYDIILIDSPPALLVTDAVSISSKVEAVIWIAQSGVITRPYLARAAHLIDRNRMPVIGFVVNRISRKTSGYGYGYDYEIYGSEYGEGVQKDA